MESRCTVFVDLKFIKLIIQKLSIRKYCIKMQHILTSGCNTETCAHLSYFDFEHKNKKPTKYFSSVYPYLEKSSQLRCSQHPVGFHCSLSLLYLNPHAKQNDVCDIWQKSFWPTGVRRLSVRLWPTFTTEEVRVSCFVWRHEFGDAACKRGLQAYMFSFHRRKYFFLL